MGMDSKIMLVDDAAFMRMTIKNCLTKAGYTNLIEAGDGAQAVDTFAKEHPDLVIMDITMPNMVVQAIQFGALDFIVKPFKPDRILQTVSKILG